MPSLYKILITMPANVSLDSPLELRLLNQLGERLKRARQERRLSAQGLAQQLGISRTTLHAAEAGAPSTTMGTYVRILGALGLVADLALVASAPSQAARTDRHEPQDLQSLLMHREAVQRLRAEPALANRALQTLARWRIDADPRSHPLLDEWERILREQDWAAALQENERGQQLRQASPLSTLLPDEVRLAIIAAIKAMKKRSHATA